MATTKARGPVFGAGIAKTLLGVDNRPAEMPRGSRRPPDDQERLVDVTLDDFEPYEYNPRLVTNAKYAEIKDSIRAIGLENEFELTRRDPDDEKMIIRNGGGTRYRILRELWEETGEDRFYRFTLKYRPWGGELAALVSHASENENRGDLVFVERALNAKRITEELEKTLADGETLTLREKAARITALGWRVNHSALTQFAYTTETLLPLIPTALYGGLGRPKVEAIRKLVARFRPLVAALGAGGGEADDAAFTRAFEQALGELDGDVLEIDDVEHRLIERLAEHLDTTPEAVRYAASTDATAASAPPPEAPPAAATPPLGPAPSMAPQGPTATPTPAPGQPITDDTTATGNDRAAFPDDLPPVPEPSAQPPADAAPVRPEKTEQALRRVRVKAQQIVLGLLGDFRELIQSYQPIDDAEQFLGFVMIAPPSIEDLESREWLSGIVYWRLYHLFHAAYRIEELSGCLDGVDLDELERDAGIAAIAGHESFENGTAFTLEGRYTELLVRQSLGRVDEREQRTLEAIEQLEELLAEHAALLQPPTTRPTGASDREVA